MSRFDWKWTIHANLFILRATGLWPEEGSYGRNLYTLRTLILTILFTLGHNFFQVCNIIFVVDSLETFTSDIYVTSASFLSLIKSYYLVKNLKTLKTLVMILKKRLLNPANRNEEILIENGLNSWKIVYQAYSCSTVVAFILLSGYPILDGSFREYRQPFPAWYPWDTKKSPVYEIMFVYQVVSQGYLATVIGNIDTLIALLNVFIGTQCDVLCDQLRNLRCTESSTGRRKLYECIQLHKEILTFTKKSNQFYDWIVFVQFFTSAINSGLTLFQLTVVSHASGQFYSSIVFESAVFMQIFMYCWFGNEVEIKSNNIPYNAFRADWVGASVHFKKDLLLLIMRSQKSLKVSALNLFYLNLNTLMKILRTSWSYFTLLQQVNK